MGHVQLCLSLLGVRVPWSAPPPQVVWSWVDEGGHRVRRIVTRRCVACGRRQAVAVCVNRMWGQHCKGIWKGRNLRQAH